MINPNIMEGSLETIYMDDFLEKGILRENPFREKVAQMDWSAYTGKRVLIKGCSDVPIPTWAYLILTAHLSQVADHILYGEPCTTIKIYNRN